ncbi:MAG: EAL domain-containing protein [Bilifractor sp.]
MEQSSEKCRLDQEVFHRLYDLLPCGICIAEADDSGSVVFVNREMAAMYGCVSEQAFLTLIGGTIFGLSIEDDLPIPVSRKEGTGSELFRFSYYTADRHMRAADGLFRVIAEKGKTYLLLQVMNWQTQMQSRVSDALTGLPGVTVFYKQALDLARSKAGEGSFAQYCPVWFNIANFRGFNREYGIAAGNRCLVHTADVLRKTFPDGLFSRTDADNFMGLLAREDLEEKIDEVCAAVNLYMGKRSCSLKAGIVKYDRVVSSDVIRHSFDMARIACESIKNDGEHSYAVFRREMREKLEMRQFILDHLDQALEEGYIKIFYQPVVRTLSGKVCSFEALARWEDPQKGMISPAVFVPVLERARRIGRLDQYMIEHVVLSLHNLLASGVHVVPVSLNLSQLDFDLIQPLKCLNQACERYQVPHSFLYIEITETVVAENRERMAAIIRNFQDAGYQVWLDDFGSDYSSLKSLNRFSFNLIKMDMEFFRYFDERSRSIVTSIVTMAKRLGMHTLAEGVETREQADFLKEIGCERIQGYYYSRPVQGSVVRSTMGERNLQIESTLEESMYGKAGLEDLVTSEPGALVLFENHTLRILSCNDAFRHELESAGIDSELEVSRTVSERTQLHYQKLLLYLNHVYDGEAQPFVLVVNGNYMRIQASFVSGIQNCWVARVHILNVSLNQDTDKIRRDDYAIRNMALLFDGIYFLNLAEDVIEVDACTHPKVSPGTVFHGIRDSFVSYCGELIHLEDQERFLDFIDEDHLLSRAASSERGFLSEAFRVRRERRNICGRERCDEGVHPFRRHSSVLEGLTGQIYWYQ